MKSRLFGFSGKYGSGKDTAAKILIDVLSEQSKCCVKIVPMALPLKRLVGMLDGRSNFCSTDEEKNMKPSKIISSEVAEILEKNVPKSVFTKYGLSDKIDMLRTEVTKIFETSETMGKVLQRVGTDLFRKKIGDNFWVDCWKEEAVSLLDSGICVFCTDVRFPNEKLALEELGGSIVRIECPLVLRQLRINTVRDPNHESETALDDVDWKYKINNDSDLQTLQNKIRSIFNN